MMIVKRKGGKRLEDVQGIVRAKSIENRGDEVWLTITLREDPIRAFVWTDYSPKLDNIRIGSRFLGFFDSDTLPGCVKFLCAYCYRKKGDDIKRVKHGYYFE